jgi:lipopolysaccharide/colanic/teichoic acid biosynthesis glycosyltransferase
MKRCFDLIFSIVALVVLAPLIIAIAIIVYCKLGPPILFRQIRPGLHAKPFMMLKFRTMRNETGKNGEQLPDAMRITYFGSFLRSASLDELPELWNVIKGEMSLVGPRPLLMEYLSLYDHKQARRHDVKPGITGWAQVNGRNGISWEKRFFLDVWYVDHQSLWLDVKILFLTIKKIFKREGISEDGEVTMSKFTGKKQ